MPHSLGNTVIEDSLVFVICLIMANENDISNMAMNITCPSIMRPSPPPPPPMLPSEAFAKAPAPPRTIQTSAQIMRDYQGALYPPNIAHPK